MNERIEILPQLFVKNIVPVAVTVVYTVYYKVLRNRPRKGSMLVEISNFMNFETLSGVFLCFWFF